MSLVLRIGLIVVSLLTLIFITRKVRNAQVKLEDSIFWFCVAGILLVFSIFPQIFFMLAKFAGIESPANLVFLLFIFILLILGFNLSVHLSQTDTKLKELTQQLAIEKFERYCNDESLKDVQPEHCERRDAHNDENANGSGSFEVTSDPEDDESPAFVSCMRD